MQNKVSEAILSVLIDDLIKVGMFKNRTDVIDVRVERLPESYPIYHQRYPREIERARTQLQGFSNLHLAGRTGMFWYNNMDHSMENAIQLVKRLLKDSGQNVDVQRLASGDHAAS